jgi:hypothetical protein
MPKITHIWVVTYPSPKSELQDICFEVNLEGLYRQFKGGLKPEDVAGLYTDVDSAQARAIHLLKQVEA